MAGERDGTLDSVEPNGKVFFATLAPGEVRLEFYKSSFSLVAHDLNHDKRIAYMEPRFGGACLSFYRNDSVASFLSTPHEWYFTVDSDIELYPEALYDLLSVADPEEKPVVSGWYMNIDGAQGIVNMAYSIEDVPIPDGRTVHKMMKLPRGSIPPDVLMKVAGVGFGIVLIHRSVLESMRDKYGEMEPWFAQESHHGVLCSEDLTFCHRLLEMDIPLYLYSKVQVAHIKPCKLMPSFDGDSAVGATG